MKFSVIVPAYNEEAYIGKCFAAIERAKKYSSSEVEVITVLNRCTDKTEQISRGFGAHIIEEPAKNLSKIRNAGARAATGDVIVTIDADSQMSENTFQEIERLLLTQKYIGGGTKIKAERISVGILMSTLVVLYFAVSRKIPSAGLFWCYKKDFDAVGGFNESMLTLEDLDFAQRLKTHGKSLGKKYGTLWKASIITSCRKFDKFGDWYFVKNPNVVRDLFSGVNHQAADKFYYELKR